jgi:mediator of RNA polymerase II transcription subunit 14
MPGLVMMERHGANGSVAPITGKRTADQAFGDASMKKMDPNALMNGEVGSPQLNGPADINGMTNAAPVQPLQPIIHESAPEIPRRPDVYKPLGELISRVTQECFNELGKTLDKTSQIQRGAQPTHTLVNGIGSHAGVNGVGINSRTNQEKKKELLDFANTYREKFIKLMVLTDWSRRVEDVRKMLDLGWWTEHQFCHYDNAKFMLADIHARLQGFKLRNPDIKTALEVLSTGKAPWMPEVSVSQYDYYRPCTHYQTV